MDDKSFIENIIVLKETKTIPDIVREYPGNLTSRIPLIIDNGSYQCRAGWATDSKPTLIFRNALAKPRKDRPKKDDTTTVSVPTIQIGNDITNLEAMRLQLKSQFDKNVVTHFEVQEHIFDYIFTKLGINTDGRVEHPVLMTEAFLNPNFSRANMNELLFECYNVPKVAYGLDALFSHVKNKIPDTCLIVSFGYHTTHVMPIIAGKCHTDKCRRINLGGFHILMFLQKLLQLKYPVHAASVTISRVEEILHNHCAIALDYIELLKKWKCPEYYEANVKKVQLPFTPVQLQTPVNIEQQKERKRELARRLIEINARKREERLAEDEEQLDQFLQIQELYEEGNQEEYMQAMRAHELSDYDELQRIVNNLHIRVERTKQKIAASNLDGEPEDKKPTISNSAMLKYGIQTDDYTVMLNELKKRRQEIIDKKQARKQRRAEMARRGTHASQQRMRIISQLARNEKGNDDFGMRDEDWDVYKAISRDGDSDSDAENERLAGIEEILRQHEPNQIYNEMNSAEAHQLHLSVEISRAPELLFQPSMVGSCEAGVSETIEYILKQFDAQTQLALVDTVFLTGGCAKYPGLQVRLERELREMRPYQSAFNVRLADNASLDAWFGARCWLGSDDSKNGFITRGEYGERGADFLKMHRASNVFCKTPAPQVPEASGEVDV